MANNKIEQLIDGLKQKQVESTADDILKMIKDRQNTVPRGRYAFDSGSYGWAFRHIQGHLIGMDLSMPNTANGQTWEPWMLPNLRRDLDYLMEYVGKLMEQEADRQAK